LRVGEELLRQRDARVASIGGFSSSVPRGLGVGPR
jgi:hypothetical protein